MPPIGKKILSAFVEVKDTPAKKIEIEEKAPTPEVKMATADPKAVADPRFVEHFDKLFDEANIPGPDYYEFARMIAAMQMIPDEQARFYAAYAGLQVQGLTKEKLLTTATAYLQVLTTDADRFRQTLDSAVREKVQKVTEEAAAKADRVQSLSKEILDLQKEIEVLQASIRENQEKLTASGSGYEVESARRRGLIQSDIEKINHYIH